MRMKIVGGPLDGDFASVGEGVSVIKLPDPQPKQTASDFDLSKPVEAIVDFHQTVYTVRQLREPDGWVLYFLAPEGWSDVRAVEHQFKK